VLIISRFPFIDLFLKCITRIGNKYFISYDLGKEFNIKEVMEDINKWNDLELNKNYKLKLLGFNFFKKRN
jgi:hypothetical protein